MIQLEHRGFAEDVSRVLLEEDVSIPLTLSAKQSKGLCLPKLKLRNEKI
jgi:hypothetical protein